MLQSDVNIHNARCIFRLQKFLSERSNFDGQLQFVLIGFHCRLKLQGSSLCVERYEWFYSALGFFCISCWIVQWSLLGKECVCRSSDKICYRSELVYIWVGLLVYKFFLLFDCSFPPHSVNSVLMGVLVFMIHDLCTC